MNGIQFMAFIVGVCVVVPLVFLACEWAWRKWCVYV